MVPSEYFLEGGKAHLDLWNAVTICPRLYRNNPSRSERAGEWEMKTITMAQWPLWEAI